MPMDGEDRPVETAGPSAASLDIVAAGFSRLNQRISELMDKLNSVEEKTQRVERGNRLLVRHIMSEAKDGGKSVLSKMEVKMPELSDALPKSTGGSSTDGTDYFAKLGMSSGDWRMVIQEHESGLGTASDSLENTSTSSGTDSLQGSSDIDQAGSSEGIPIESQENVTNFSSTNISSSLPNQFQKPTHLPLPRRSPLAPPLTTFTPGQRSEASRSSDHHLAEVLRLVPALIFRTNQLGAQTFASSYTRELIGVDPSQTLGYGFSALIHPDDRQMVLDYSIERQTRQERIDLTYRLVKPGTGETIWTRTIALPSFDPETTQFVGYVGAVIDVNDTMAWRREAEEKNKKLDAALKEARQAAEAKDSFLASVSHELRSPLNGIIGMSGLLRSSSLFHGTPQHTAPASAEDIDLLDMLCQCSEGLLTIVNDLLDISKIANNKLVLNPGIFRPDQALNTAVQVLRPQASRKGVELAFDAKEIPEIWGDSVRLRQVVFNLLENGIKFTETGGKVALKVWTEDAGTWRGDGKSPIDETYFQSGVETGRTLIFSVTDTGCGFLEEATSKIFEPFTQADSSMSRQYGGVGLGLAISKQLLGYMRGSIEGSSPGPGKGATFIVRMPMLAPKDDLLFPAAITLQAPSGTFHADGSVVPVRELMRSGTDEEDMIPSIFSSAPLKAAQSFGSGDSDSLSTSGPINRLKSSSPTPSLISNLSASTPTAEYDRTLGRPACKILLAEDNIINVKLTLKLLAKLGYHSCDVASDGLECIDKIMRAYEVEKDMYDLVLCDLQMPNCSGFEAAETVRAKLGEDEMPPFVALTANVMERDRQKCAEVGMVGFLEKPLRMQELGVAVEKYRTIRFARRDTV